MCPVSLLELVATIVGVHPIFINAAAFTNDPIERLKLVITSTVSFIYPTHQFEKPVSFLKKS